MPAFTNETIRHNDLGPLYEIRLTQLETIRTNMVHGDAEVWWCVSLTVELHRFRVPIYQKTIQLNHTNLITILLVYHMCFSKVSKLFARYVAAVILRGLKCIGQVQTAGTMSWVLSDIGKSYH